MAQAPQPAARSVAINRLHYPVLTLGYGQRVGVWFQGCSIHCPGCIVPDTWSAEPEHSVPVAALIQALDRWLPKCDGVTISGGEPFDQPEALELLLLELKRRFPVARPGSPIDLLVYSGYTFRTLQSRHARILSLADVIVAGPFVERLEDDRPFVGSANQTIHLLTPLAEQRYHDTPFQRGFTIDYRNGVIYMAGVPKRGEVAQLEESLKKP